jgi:hypothetical protein
LFRYKASGSYYTVLKKDGKTKWRNLKTDDKTIARRMLLGRQKNVRTR